MAVHRHFPRNTILLSETIEAWLLLAGIALAVWITQSDLIPLIVAQSTQFGTIGSFIEGFFFTSVLTTVPAIVAIFESAAYVPAFELALLGGAGAVCGDLLIFRFVRSRLVERILQAALHPRMVRIGKAMGRGPLWWLGPLCGFVLIASPFPDELGLFMMGLSRIRLIWFIPLAFVANAAGIFLIALAGQHVL